MYQHQSHQGHNNLISSSTMFSPERQLFTQRGSAAGESGLVLSTDAKPRLKWNADLHEKFIDAVNQLGGADKATPKTIMRLMSIPGLTLYHLKSHLQKYRLGKNHQDQTNTESNKNVIGCTLAAERAPEGNASPSINIAAPTNKTMQINEALKMQIEVQRQLQEQLQVQRHLQLRIEAQGKYLQSVLEKAQETLGKQNLGSSTGLEVAKIQLSNLVSKVSNGYFSNSCAGLEENCGLHLLQLNPARVVDCSIDSCMTSSEGRRKEQDALDANMGMTAYNENFSLCMEQYEEHTRLEQTQKAWCGDLGEQKTFTSSILRDSGRATFPCQRDSNIIQANGKHQIEGEECTISREVRKKERDEDKFLEHPSCKRQVLRQENRKQSDGFGIPCLKTELELKIHQDNEGASSCKKFDLNGFSWN
ncbi:hypothetical protein Cni_G23510 [Canna indica]|uniref:HTH myb-type domain-containing protein n=1 Tax=Canna indica TaxID=4628 RepID=A0AAQ3QKI5_9LILI|nr:hypothetical protein Cni_G23510 [Canna indica]